MSRQVTIQSLAVVIGSITFGYVLLMLPASDTLRWMRPNFLLLIVVFWLLNSNSVGIGVAWLLGLVLDGISGGLLGAHALSFALVAYIVLVMHHRIRVFGLLKQLFLVFFLLSIDQLVADWVHRVIEGGQHQHYYWLSGVLLGTLAWPWLNAWLGRYQALL